MNERLQVVRAIERIESGLFGECRDCGDLIAPKRLAVQPSASLCVECQCQKEAHSRSVVASLRKLVSNGMLPFFCSGAELL